MNPERDFKKIYYLMLQTRFLEEIIIEEHRQGRTFGPIHLCIGQEAAGVGACASLRTDDVVCPTHRGHAVYLGKGVDLEKLCCEIWGKAEGYGRGRAGHMLIFDKKHGVLGGSGIVGGGLPVAVGHALAFQYRGQDRTAVAFFGDGASNTGAFHESLNLAAKWKLPVVFFCENNRYGLTVHVDDHLSAPNIAVRAQAYGLPGKTVFGNDMVEVDRVMTEAVERARSGGGPTLIEAETYRMHGFSTSDGGGYQRPEELDYWSERDPLKLAEARLLKSEICDADEISELRRQAREDVAQAVAYAQAAAYPDQPSPGAIYKQEVYGG